VLLDLRSRQTVDSLHGMKHEGRNNSTGGQKNLHMNVLIS